MDQFFKDLVCLMNLGDNFLDLIALPTLMVGVTLKNT